MDIDTAQRWADDLLDELPPETVAEESLAPQTRAEPFPAFSPFLPEHADRAREASRALMIAADEAGGEQTDQLEAVAVRVSTLQVAEPPGVVRAAVKLFLTHHPAGRGVRIAPLERRAPWKVVPSARPVRVDEGLVPQESDLDWWREDPEANEHHDHWHSVYPTTGIAAPAPGAPNRTRLQDRQGELFMYMHQQMLARYDTERAAVGLPPVKPLAEHNAAIDEGYDPATGLTGFPPTLWTPDGPPRPRPAGATMAASFTFTMPPGQPPVTVTRADLDAWFTRLDTAVSTQKIRFTGIGEVPLTDTDQLGHAIEPSFAIRAASDPPQPDRGFYGNFHGQGHILLAAAAGEPLGVMSDTDTAIRDPVFFRWHRHVDDLAFRWQEMQSPHALSETAARIELHRRDGRAPGRPAECADIILVRDLPEGSDAEVAAHIAGLVGGDHSDDDFADTAPGTAELRTEMRDRLLDIEELPGPGTVPIRYLDQDEFAYAVRLRNPTGVDRDVTVRLFIVADAFFDQRRMWIELDKFTHTVRGEVSVAVRHARASAVIRKPGLKPPGPTGHSDPDADPHAEVTYCDCGWPYNLLLPRGTGEGMPFWIAAIVTDGEGDQVEESACGSMSFCGAKDRYPDARPMGFPFDRPFPDDDIAAALDSLPSTGARSFTIRWLNPDD